MIKLSALENTGYDSMIPALGGFWLDWAITMTAEHQRIAPGVPTKTPQRWFLDATVDIVFFKAFCVALAKVGVTPMERRGPAVFRNIDKYSVDGMRLVKFRLEALDLRLVPDRHQLDQLSEGYFLAEGEA